MPSWKVEFTLEAEEDLAKLDSSVRKRIIEKIIWLRDNFEKTSPLPLSGRWRGFFKLRVGNWRVIYEFEETRKKITIHRIDKRDKIYKIK